MSLYNFFKNLFAIKPKSRDKSHPLDGLVRVKEAPYKIETTAQVEEVKVEPTPVVEPQYVPPVAVESKPVVAATDSAVEVKKIRKSSAKTQVEKVKPATSKAKTKKTIEPVAAKKPRGRKPRAK